MRHFCCCSMQGCVVEGSVGNVRRRQGCSGSCGACLVGGCALATRLWREGQHGDVCDGVVEWTGPAPRWWVVGGPGNLGCVGCSRGQLGGWLGGREGRYALFPESSLASGGLKPTP